MRTHDSCPFHITIFLTYSYRSCERSEIGFVLHNWPSVPDGAEPMNGMMESSNEGIPEWWNVGIMEQISYRASTGFRLAVHETLRMDYLFTIHCPIVTSVQ